MKDALVLDPFSGISGDMFLGAMVDVGVDFEALRATLLKISALEKVSAECETVTRGVFTATRIVVECPHEHAHRGLSAIREIIDTADLPAQVKSGAIETFTRLAKAEAKVHGHDIEKVHFHEVGALDAIFDIVGMHLALDQLDYPRGFTRPLSLGSGSTKSAHGEIPLPAPATIELLSGHTVRFTERTEELVTPTGAAIVASTFEPLPPDVTVIAGRVGYGAGSRENDGLPNVLRILRGSVDEARRHVCVVTSTIDDMNPEMYGYLMEKLFAEGVLDVYYNSVMMKKNRPGTEVTVITEEKDVYRIADLLMGESTTLGVRIQREERVELARHKEEIETTYGTILIKVADRPDGGQRMSPEYESCKAAAERSRVDLLSVYEEARRVWEATTRKK